MSNTEVYRLKDLYPSISVQELIETLQIPFPFITHMIDIRLDGTKLILNRESFNKTLKQYIESLPNQGQDILSVYSLIIFVSLRTSILFRESRTSDSSLPKRYSGYNLSFPMKYLTNLH